ncbi:hypothetical protein VHEMI10057 [[Torrubiella] hemipterigena]|uniref:Uncharacterized protein n=1 Tax=[Torrubiella] hemipterigena TaxID=1531966 RepID=A0A0A1THT7_9HYPO|nr:hypothetical protein VHEMI10057 [[Torrubiella] hemipterigena]
MLAAHRDQENLVRTHVPTKQAPKTPGARYPKTPLKFGGDENAGGLFTKGGRAGGEKLVNQQLITPAANTVRAPLGNKTTNAKAIRGQATEKRGFVNVEKTQFKPLTAQKPKQKVTSAPPLFEVQADVRNNDQEEEPEYAPAKAPRALSYKSDVLPENGLTFKGLHRKHILSGYFEHFYNDVDAKGRSRSERALQAEKRKALDQMEQQNALDIDAMTWNVADTTENHMSVLQTRPASRAVTGGSRSSKRPTSALASRPTPSKAAKAKPALSNVTVSNHNRARSIQSSIPSRTIGTAASAGEIASRNSLGYRKGRAVSSILQPKERPKSINRLALSQTVNDRDTTCQRDPGLRSAMELNHELMNSLCDDDSDIELAGVPAISALSLEDASDAEEDFQLRFDF